jgi:hypothetical protein
MASAPDRRLRSVIAALLRRRRDIPDAVVEVLPPSVIRTRRPTVPLGTDEIEDVTCEIAAWRGYRSATFYARMFDGDQEIAVAESPSFRPLGEITVARSEAAVRAHTALCDALVAAGWVRTGRGDTWYADLFRGSIKAVEEPEPD